MRTTSALALVLALLLSAVPGNPRHVFAVAAPSISVAPQQFSPNGDGERDTARITVTLAEAAKLQVRITNAAGNTVTYLQSFASKAKGTYRYVWDGTAKNAENKTVKAPEGTYYADAATQGADGTIERRTAKFYLNNTLRYVEVGAFDLAYNWYPKLFSPGRDGRKDNLTATFIVARPADVTMRILQGTRELRVLKASYLRAGSGSMTWNGMVANGSGGLMWAPNGVYDLWIDAQPSDAARAASLGAAHSNHRITVDRTRPAMTATLSRTAISQNAFQTVRLNYTAKEIGFRRVQAVNASGKVVYTTEWEESGTTGSFTWRGIETSGSLTAPGKYTLKLYYQDRAGNAALTYPWSKTVTVTRQGPVTSQSARIPWSGYWWPSLNTADRKLYNNPGPMTKYDTYAKATGRPVGAHRWESTEPNYDDEYNPIYWGHKTTNPANDWWGHCQAWAAAAMMETQPAGKTVKGITFTQDDAEGLFAETWTSHVGDMYGTVYDTEFGKNSEEYADVHPAEFDGVVLYWIGHQKKGLMMDLSTGHELWNYPVYAFTRTSRFSGSKEYVTMTIRHARPLYGQPGTVGKSLTLYYTLQPGTRGIWSNPDGSSVHTHPDYVFKVDGRAEPMEDPSFATDLDANPYIEVKVLSEIFR